ESEPSGALHRAEQHAGLHDWNAVARSRLAQRNIPVSDRGHTARAERYVPGPPAAIVVRELLGRSGLHESRGSAGGVDRPRSIESVRGDRLHTSRLAVW